MGPATIICALVLAGLAVHFLRSLFAPFLLAVFLLILIEGFARTLRRYAGFLPHAVAAGLAVMTIIISFAGLVWIGIANVSGLLSNASEYQARLEELARTVDARIGGLVQGGLDGLVQRFDLPAVAGVAATWLRTAVSAAVLVIIYVAFMMASASSFDRKLSAVSGGGGKDSAARAALERIRDGVVGYVWVQSVTGLMIAVPSWLLLWVCGVPSPLFWTLVIFVSSYVPIVGGIVGVFAPVAFSLMVFDSLVIPLWLLAGLEFVQLIIGNIVQPRMQGGRLNLDPVVLLFALGLWSTLLGPVGAFLATPLTVAMMVILSQWPRTAPIAALLSADGRVQKKGGGSAAAKK